MVSGDGPFEVHPSLTHPALLHASGELDASTAAVLADSLAQVIATTDADAVELDLEQVTFIDSSGLQAITAALRELRASGRDLRVTVASRAVRRIFEVTGLQGVLQLPDAAALDP